MWHDPCEHALHCIHVLDSVYVQMIPAESIAHPFPVFPLLICRCSWRIGATLTFILGTDLLDLGSSFMLNILFTVVVWRYSCFLDIQIHLLFSFKTWILCGDCPTCGPASIYNLLIGEFFIIYYCRGCIPQLEAGAGAQQRTRNSQFTFQT